MIAEIHPDQTLAAKLLRPEAFSHEVTNLQLLETHISWVILTGPFAYKIKKPVRFDFVDYSTPSLRRRYCRQELELNRRFAHEIYLAVVPIYECGRGLVVGSCSLEDWEREFQAQPVDFAVKMREFSQDSIVAARLQNSELTPIAVERFGETMARFHESIVSNPPPNECGTFGQIEKDAMGNFSTMFDAFQFDRRFELVKQLERWTSSQLNRLEPKFKQRREARKIRQCHGDLHLKNIVQLNGQLEAFDGIEFNEQFQWIDLLSEIAFPVMDFVARGRADFGWRLLNSYLESTGDYMDLDLLRFYLVYRAMVRAKVTWLNPANRTEQAEMHLKMPGSGTTDLCGSWDKYLQAASYFAFDLKPSLSITHGLSGSGKSTQAMRAIEGRGGIRVRSDVERQRIAAKLKQLDKYSPEISDWVYIRLMEIARSIMTAGFPVVVDATFLERRRRALFLTLANELGVVFRILDCAAPFEALCQRIENRGNDPSEATVDVLKMQMESHEPLAKDERHFVEGNSIGHHTES